MLYLSRPPSWWSPLWGYRSIYMPGSSYSSKTSGKKVRRVSHIKAIIFNSVYTIKYLDTSHLSRGRFLKHTLEMTVECEHKINWYFRRMLEIFIYTQHKFDMRIVSIKLWFLDSCNFRAKISRYCRTTMLFNQHKTTPN